MLEVWEGGRQRPDILVDVRLADLSMLGTLTSRGSSGHPVVSPIKDESTRFATLYPFSKRAREKHAYTGGNVVAALAALPSSVIEYASRVCRPFFFFVHANPRAACSVSIRAPYSRSDTD